MWHNITSTLHHRYVQMRNTKRYIIMTYTKGAHESQRENSRAEQGAWNVRASNGLPMIHVFAAHLWSVTGRIHGSKLRDLDIRIQGSQKLPNEWYGECQVACRKKYMCIDKSESKSMHWKLCRKHMHTGAGREIVSDIKQGTCMV